MIFAQRRLDVAAFDRTLPQRDKIVTLDFEDVSNKFSSQLGHDEEASLMNLLQAAFKWNIGSLRRDRYGSELHFQAQSSRQVFRVPCGIVIGRPP